MVDTVIINEVVDSIVIAVGGEQGPPGITDFNPTISFIGDVTGTGTTGSAVTTVLANTSVVAGVYGNSAKTLTITVDSKGRLTSIQENTPLLDASSISSGFLAAARMPALSGDVTSNSGSVNISLSNTGVTAGTYTKVTVDSKGRVLSALNPASLSGYGIVDAYNKTEVDTLVANATPDFDTLVGKPTTLSGYGITDAVNSSALGNTVATLDSGKRIPPSQLPSYVDAIEEYASISNFPATGVTSVIYIDAGTKKSYRWTGTSYVDVGSAGGSAVVTFANIIGKPSTLAGYNILDGVNSSLLGTNDGVATLGPTGKLTTSQMPAAVDEIQNINTFNELPVNGLTNVVYLVLDTNKIYRFSGEDYVEISSAGTADEAIKLHTPRTISMTGDVVWSSADFDGSQNVTSVASLATSGITAGTYTKVSFNNKGIAVSGSNPTTLTGFGITDAVKTSDLGSTVATLVEGKIPSTQLPSYVDDVIEIANYSSLPAVGESGKIYTTVDTNKTYRWTGSTYIEIGGTTTDASALTTGTLNYQRLPALIGDVTLSQGSNSTALSTTGVTAGSYGSPSKAVTITVDSKGRLSNVVESDISIPLSKVTDANTKQDLLVSGTNIKSINGASILGSGNIEIAGGGSTATPIIFTLTDGELIVEHLSNFTPSIVDGEFIAEYT